MGFPGLLAATWRTELQPDPGRLSQAASLTAVILITVTLCMALRVPEAALSCYLIFFAWRDNMGDSLFTAIKLILAASLAVLIASPILQAVVDQPMLRIAALAGFTLLGMFLSQASRLGEMAGTAGFVFAFMLTLYDIVPVPELLSRALEWIWVVLVLPMVVMALWAGFFGPRPLACADALIAERQAALMDPQGPKAQALLDEGMGRMDGYLRFARMMGEARGKQAAALAARADHSYYALVLAEAGLMSRPGSGATSAARAGFFHPDAFTNPRSLRFALKVLVAVLITYSFYTIFGMFEIHTAMITCFYVALGTTGATRHKIVLRMIGCLVGAGAGLIALLLVMPHASDIGWLLAPIVPVTFLAAWISLGSERISYAGWQMALCFYLVILHGFAPPGDFAAGADRIIGILIGAGVVWVTFTLLWPEDAAAEIEALLAQGAALASVPRPRSGREAAALRAPLARLTALERDAAYERTSFPHGDLHQARRAYLSALERSFHAPA